MSDGAIATYPHQELRDAVEGARRLVRACPGAMPLGLDGAQLNNDGVVWTVRISDDGAVVVAAITGAPMPGRAERLVEWLSGKGVDVAFLRLPPPVSPGGPA